MRLSVRARVKRLFVSLLEALGHCATDFAWISELAAENAAQRCPDYIPDWLMEAQATR